MSIEVHPAAELFPLLEGERLEALREDLKRNGQRQAIILHRDGRLIDGRNRHAVLLELGVEPFFQTWAPADGDDGPAAATSFVLSLNLHRRNLTASQRACVAVKALGDELSPERQRERRLEHLKKARASIGQDCPVEESGYLWWADQAQRFETSEGYLKRAARLHQEDPASFEAVWRGERELPEVARLKLEAEKAADREENAAKVAELPPAEVSAGAIIEKGIRYSTITIDPPWRYEETDDGSSPRGNVRYATMGLEEIAAMRVGEMASENAHLYCWTTPRFLEQTFGLLRGWGFEVKGILVWKKSFGVGMFFRNDVEFVLFGARGTGRLKVMDQGCLFEGAPAEGRRHSSKPIEFYDLVERCSHGPYLEIFARGERAGWTSFGEEGIKA